MFLIYNPVVGGLIPGGPDGEQANAALRQVREQVGETVWKAGNSLRRPGGPTELARRALDAAGIKVATAEGILKSVAYAKTGDGRNEYHKVRVCLANPGQGDTMISVDVGSEVGERLIQKLDQLQLRQKVEISAFAKPADGDRPYVNHGVSVKSGGQEVPNTKGVYERLKDKASTVEAALKGAGVTDAKTLKDAVVKAKAAESLAIHIQMVRDIEQRLKGCQQAGQPAGEKQAEPV